MSTKIYNGFRFKSKNIATVQSNLIKAKLASTQTTKDILHKTSDIESFIEQCYHPAKDILVIKNRYNYWQKLQELAFKDLQPYWVPTVNFDICIYTHSSGIYGVWFGNNKYLKHLSPYIQEFPYYDNTDGPSDISYKQWEKRGKLWEKLIGGGRFNKISLDFKFVKPMDFLENRDFQLAFYNTLECLGIKN